MLAYNLQVPNTKWVGPFTIIDDLGRGLYRLEAVNDPDKVLSRVNGVYTHEKIPGDNS